MSTATPDGSTIQITRTIEGLTWPAVADELDEVGCALAGAVLDAAQCRTLIDLYGDGQFRSTIDMARHRFGQGEYRYFDHPLPLIVRELRAAFWPHLLPIARLWAERRDQPAPWPDDLVFPLQVAIGLDEPGVDYTGGEFIVVEQRPRSQSRATATTIERGHALVFTTRDRPIATARGWSNGPMRHGVSVVRRGMRHTLGLIFHDAT